MKHSLLLSLLMFVCLGVFGQSSTVPSQKVTLNSLQNTVDSQRATITTLQDSIRYLRADNADLRKQLDRMGKNMEEYKWYFGQTVDDYNDKIAIGIAIITLILAVFGIAIPYFMNSRNEKYISKLIEDTKKQAQNAESELNKIQPKVEEAKKQAGEIQTAHNTLLQKVQVSTAQAENARSALTNFLQKVQEATKQASEAGDQAKNAEKALNNIQKKVDNTTKDAESAAKKAKAVQFFVQALQESDEKRALELYDNCIAQDPNFAEAYNNRGFLKHKIGFPDANHEAKDDYTKAIELFEEEGRGIYAEAYNNRGILYFENNDLKEAENDFNAAISKDYAEAYLNHGLLKIKMDKIDEAQKDFDNAIAKKSNFAEAIYVRGLWRYSYYLNDEYAIADIIDAKSIKNDVAEFLPIRSLLTGKMKTTDSYFNGVEYSKDMTKLVRVFNDKIDSFIIPRFVTDLGDAPFIYSPNLKVIYVEERNPNYCSRDGILYSKDMSTLIAVPTGKNSIEILNDVSAIGDGAFAGCINLTSVIIPNNVTEIGHHAFFRCTSLTSIEIPDSIIEIKYYAFQGCKSLTSIKIPKRVTRIANATFIDCINLKSIEISNGVTFIGDEAFHGCSNLTSITIPDSVGFIGPYAFYGCTKLGSIEFPKIVAFIGWNAFEGCTSLTTITIPDGLSEIADHTFRGCTQLTSIVIPDSVNKIGEHAFEGCTNLKEMHLKHTTPLDFVASLLFLNRYQVTIIVPRGSREAYQNSGLYMGFKNIIEEGEEKSGQAPS